ncbi:unnamed protein product [Diabrotica balteata]|uniref:Uncharacterized protein n=1 Tax=Diabrotica balteata TaxID=107213 RepID=A0A9N9SQW9_DIABA|nr:unnamed protein product [Diabrotica balteata]
MCDSNGLELLAKNWKLYSLYNFVYPSIYCIDQLSPRCYLLKIHSSLFSGVLKCIYAISMSPYFSFSFV